VYPAPTISIGADDLEEISDGIRIEDEFLSA
jgi:hypothetical protein